MEDRDELIEVALTAVIALAVGLTSASFGRDSSVVGSSGGTTRMRILVDKVMQALAPTEQEASTSLRRHVEI
jgi:hypothetical protein